MRIVRLATYFVSMLPPSRKLFFALVFLAVSRNSDGWMEIKVKFFDEQLKQLTYYDRSRVGQAKQLGAYIENLCHRGIGPIGNTVMFFNEFS